MGSDSRPNSFVGDIMIDVGTKLRDETDDAFDEQIFDLMSWNCRRLVVYEVGIGAYGIDEKLWASLYRPIR